MSGQLGDVAAVLAGALLVAVILVLYFEYWGRRRLPRLVRRMVVSVVTERRKAARRPPEGTPAGRRPRSAGESQRDGAAGGAPRPARQAPARPRPAPEDPEVGAAPVPQPARPTANEVTARFGRVAAGPAISQTPPRPAGHHRSDGVRRPGRDDHHWPERDSGWGDGHD